MSHPVCGIDFGTSNSALSLGAETSLRLLPVEQGEVTMPSALFFDEEERACYLGRAAQQAYMDGAEGRFMRSLKRVLGTSLMTQKTVVNGKAQSFHDIIGAYLGHFKAVADANGQAVDHVVMGRPVHFVDGDVDADQRAENELRQIAENIGFKHIDFQFEPIAAAFAHEQHITGEKLALVVDIGGGTSDFTVIRLSEDRKHAADRSDDILANTGVRIGGNDFDKALSLAEIMPHFGYGTIYGAKNLPMPKRHYHDISEWSKVNKVYAPKVRREFHEIYRQSHDADKVSRFLTILDTHAGHRLLHDIEMAKIHLSDNMTSNIDFSYIEKDLNTNILRGDFNLSLVPHVAPLEQAVNDCIQLSGNVSQDIDLIILTGGSASIPYVRDQLSQFCPQAEISQENKLSSVALGLGHDALRKFA